MTEPIYVCVGPVASEHMSESERELHLLIKAEQLAHRESQDPLTREMSVHNQWEISKALLLAQSLRIQRDTMHRLAMARISPGDELTNQASSIGMARKAWRWVSAAFGS